MEDIANIGQALLLLVVANSAALAIGTALGKRWAKPLDLGIALKDGQRLFGSHKTWRGLLAGALACALTADLLGLGFMFGAGFGTVSLLGDALSSAIKRRLRFAPGVEVPGLDQLPEALLPLMIFGSALHLESAAIAIVAIAFTILDVAVIRLRQRWYAR